MTDAELSTIESLARAATPGPWHNRKGYKIYDEGNAHIASAWEEYSLKDGIRDITGSEAKANAAYIAAANPDKILLLIAALRQTQIERDWLAEKCESMAHALDPCEFYPSYYWTDQAKTYAKEIACQKN